VPQMVYYQPGVGTGTWGLANSIDAATGKGTTANIREAYSFLCHNYTRVNHFALSDDIILIGFSRGAFTARCLAQFIHDVGILRKAGLVALPKLFELWENQLKSGNQRRLEHECDQLAKKKYLYRRVRINVCAVWDTVASLGSVANLGSQTPQWLTFVNSKLCCCIENAFQALALHERRKQFLPIPWRTGNTGQNLKQCWFLGCHGDVGGGVEDPILAHISLVWMLSQLRPFLKM
ncbi:hypothetical protein GQ53DRAFT_586790, partial [Thozetella sp. PMI_491]